MIFSKIKTQKKNILFGIEAVSIIKVKGLLLELT